MKMKKPEFRFSLTEITILFIAFSVVIGLCGILTCRYWYSNMTISLSEDASVIIGDSDVTDVVQYQAVTNSFQLGLIFTAFGMLWGFLIDTALSVLYLAIKIVVHLIRTARFNKKNKTENADTPKAETKDKNKKDNRKDKKHERSRKNKQKV